eukprot:GFUD01125502.1.p1 GENE.GFUD01125502.1~~GFUD01125502.1.p1  ORF type:complete len:197 (-),score=77.09 GFUD01125502.1:120-710(-)
MSYFCSYSPISPPYSGSFPHHPEAPSYNGEEDPYSPGGEEEGNTFFGKMLAVEPAVNENDKEGLKKENLDMRLNRLMQGDDLPLFLQEFVGEWHEERRKKNKGDPEGSMLKRQLKEESRMKVQLVLKKNLKRLALNGVKGIMSCDLKDLARKMVKVVKEQVKEDILEQMVSNQVDSWYLSHSENLGKAGQADTEDN